MIGDERDKHQSTQSTQSTPSKNQFWQLKALLSAVARYRHNLNELAHYRLQQGHWLLQRGITSLKTRGLTGTYKRIQNRWAHINRSNHKPGALPHLLGMKGSKNDAIDPSQINLRPTIPQRSDPNSAPSVPRASIIIPVFNQLQHTLLCLQSLMTSGDSTPFEVIVVDDNSTDATQETLAGIVGLRYHRNPENIGFIGACNAGAKLAHSEFLVFLNNDTYVQPGWLDTLLSTFNSHPDTGLVGSKLIYPNGQLQEAGGIVFSDGSCWNLGRFEDPGHPSYNFLRETDYCSGAAIALPRKLFERLDGFDTNYSPAYYEDTDLAMRVRQHGLKVRYQPASTVVHFEGISSGTDALKGVKAYQTVNEKKFFARWQATLSKAHLPPHSKLELAAQHNVRSHVLVIDAFTPKPDRDSGSVRLVELMTLLLEENCSVSFLPENLKHEGPYTETLQQLGVKTWWHPWVKNIPQWLAAHGHHFDVVIVSRHYVLTPLLPLLRKYAPQAHIVFDTVDLHFLREQREAEQAKNPGRIRTAARTRETETTLVKKSDTTWVVSTAEKILLEKIVSDAHVEVISNIHHVVSDTPGQTNRHGLIFVGNYRHPPNVDAAHWLTEDIFPLIQNVRPEIELHLVGGDAPASVQALNKNKGVHFHGHVADLNALLDQMRISLAPLRYGAGVKGKINHSLARGLPTIATPCAVEGMHLTDNEDILIAETPEHFTDAVLRLYDDVLLWQRLREGGLENTRRHFSRETAREGITSFLSTLTPN